MASIVNIDGNIAFFKNAINVPPISFVDPTISSDLANKNNTYC